jgi:hypothetical protein
MNNIVTEKMIALMHRQELKDAGLNIAITLNDGTRRTGQYKDLVINPLNHPDHKNKLFVKFVTHRPERDLIVYLPLSSIAKIDWALDAFVDKEKRNEV